MTGLLQVFLILQVFFLGVLVAIAAHHAYHAYVKPARANPNPNGHPGLPPNHQMAQLDMPPAVRQHLLNDSQRQFQSVVNNSAARFQHDLENTSLEVSSLIKRLSADIVESELKRFHDQLSQMQKQTEAQMGGIRTEIAKHQQELKAKLDQDMQLEKQRLIKQIDTKLADAVASFLLDTMQHNVDLGNQNAFLVSMLEEHKADFVKEVGQNEPS